MRTIITISICLIFAASKNKAQDIHFSQYYNSMQFINPALTGPSECMYRGTMQYRNQWASISTPYITQYVGFDMQHAPEKKLFDWFGLGGYIFNDKAGSGNLQTTKAMLSGSYTKAFDTRNAFSVSLGASIGLYNKRIDKEALTFDSQWDGRTFDQSMSQMEYFERTAITQWDFNAGMSGSYSFSRWYVFQAGVSLSHINRPKENFFPLSRSGQINKLGMKTTIHAEYLARFSQVFHIRPGAMLSLQKGTYEMVYGSNQLITFDKARVGLGIWHRHMRDIIPTLSLEMYKFAFIISYDVNVSSLERASGKKGGVELSLTRSFKCGKKIRNRNGFENCPSWQMEEW